MIGAVLGAAAVIAVLLAPAQGAVHAIIVDSVPRQGDAVAAAPWLLLRFNSRIEKTLCRVTLVGPGTRTILLLHPTTDAGPDTLKYLLPRLAPGPYRVRWKVFAVDGHVTEGTIAFSVVAPPG